jgi:hypothetical protein
VQVEALLTADGGVVEFVHAVGYEGLWLATGFSIL